MWNKIDEIVVLPVAIRSLLPPTFWLGDFGVDPFGPSQGLSSSMTECWAPGEQRTQSLTVRICKHFPRFVRICGSWWSMMNHRVGSSSKPSCLTSLRFFAGPLGKPLKSSHIKHLHARTASTPPSSQFLYLHLSSSMFYLAFWERLLWLADRHRPAVPMAFSASSVDFTVSLLDDKETCQELRIQCGDSGSQLSQ